MIVKIFIFGLFVSIASGSSREELVVPVGERVKLLKYQLKQQIKETMRNKNPEGFFLATEEPPVLNADYDYVDLARLPITPINEKDDRKRNRKFRLRQLATSSKPTTLWTWKSSWPMETRPEVFTTTANLPKVYNPISDDNIAKLRMNRANKYLRARHKKKPRKQLKPNEPSTEKPYDIFYRQRRILMDQSARDQPIKWIHCEDMITPYLIGVKGDYTATVLLSPSHRNVMRLVHLLSMNVTNYGKEDIYSLMYQISNLQLRLFQWDGAAIRVLLNTITANHGYRHHTYTNIRKGIKKLFQSWHLDFSNVTNLLAQSRIFRPYCIPSKGQAGSTKSSKVVQYKSTATTVMQCGDDECIRKQVLRNQYYQPT